MKVIFQGLLVSYIITLPLNVNAQFWIGEFYDLSRSEVIRNHSEEQSIYFKVVSDNCPTLIGQKSIEELTRREIIRYRLNPVRSPHPIKLTLYILIQCVLSNNRDMVAASYYVEFALVDLVDSGKTIILGDPMTVTSLSGVLRRYLQPTYNSIQEKVSERLAEYVEAHLK